MMILIDHGLDGYEEWIDPKEVIFMRLFYRPIGDEDAWKVKLFFRNGLMEETSVNQKGYDILLKLFKVQ